MKEIKPTEESIRHFLDYTWKDIHHSRLQNWTGITVVTAFHIGILKIIEYCLDSKIVNYQLFAVILFFGALFSLIGYLITKTHQIQLYEKLDWIKNAQRRLYTSELIDELKTKMKRKRSLPKNLKNAGSLMGYFYLLLMIVDILSILYLEAKVFLQFV